MADEMKTAMVNRSLRSIKMELEFLADAALLSPQQVSSIVSQLPNQTDARTTATTAAAAAAAAAATPSPSANLAPAFPIRNGSNASFNERQNNSLPNYNEKQHYNYDRANSYNNGYASPAPNIQSPSPAPPPAYPTPPAPPALPEQTPVLSYAVALYSFAPTDAGDLPLTANDRIAVTEYMNAEWWKGRSLRTGQEGIFPRSYVRVEDREAPPPPTNYGNMPVDVAQGSGDPYQQQQQVPGQPSKGAEMGKKFGRKLGNAAIFGAGATMGADLVNAIL